MDRYQAPPPPPPQNNNNKERLEMCVYALLKCDPLGEVGPILALTEGQLMCWSQVLVMCMLRRYRGGGP